VLAWTAKANKRVQFGYGFNYLIDIGIAAARLCHANVCRPDSDVGEREPLNYKSSIPGGDVTRVGGCSVVAFHAPFRGAPPHPTPWTADNSCC
jgi:hypothetical protein